MTNPVSGISSGALYPSTPTQQTPDQIAKAMVEANSDRRGAINFSELKRDLAGLKAKDPALGAQVENELRTQLGPNSFARLSAASFAVQAKDGTRMTIAPDAPTVESYFKGTANQSLGKTAAERTAIRQADLAFYARLDRIWGDGNPKTFDGDAIDAGINDMVARGMSLDNVEKFGRSAPTTAVDQTSASYGPLLLDLTQMTLDVVGIFDQTGLSDGANALISIGRGDWVGAGFSALAIIPVVGALATAGKLGKWAATVAKAVDAAISNPAARQMLEPTLKKLNDALSAIPDSVMRNLPDEMRTTLEGLKTKLDELFGSGAKKEAAQNNVNDIPAPKPGEPGFVGPLDLNTQAAKDVGKVTAPIDFDGHILRGEIKANGNVVGGHSLVSGEVRIIPGTESAANPQGVYRASIEVADPANPGNWVPKTNGGGFSTMFPKTWSGDRIKVEVDAAYQNRVISGSKWTGITPSGVKVEGFTSPKTTVYPIY